MTIEESLAKAIAEHPSSVNCGSAKNGPSDEWLAKAESRIGVPFPPSYRWFLKSYGGGEVFGNEVFSIYCMDFDEVNGGDVVFQWIANSRDGTLRPWQIPVLQTDFGELFFMDASGIPAGEEYPVYVKRGTTSEKVADSFGEFLRMHIEGD